MATFVGDKWVHLFFQPPRFSLDYMERDNNGKQRIEK